VVIRKGKRMIRVSVQVRSGAAWFRVAVQAQSIERALEMVKRYNLGKEEDCRVAFPIDPETTSSLSGRALAEEVWRSGSTSGLRYPSS
jgi:hypothetical protein